MQIRRLSFRFMAYAWAAPNTLLGLAIGLVMLCLGGQLRLIAGVAEFHGGWLGRIVARAPKSVSFGAMTLGHAIVGVDQATLRDLRAHEHAHVRQYEQWGLFFLPAYVLSSLWQVINSRSAHASNFFERQACAMASVALSEHKLLTNPQTFHNCIYNKLPINLTPFPPDKPPPQNLTPPLSGDEGKLSKMLSRSLFLLRWWYGFGGYYCGKFVVNAIMEVCGHA